MLHGDKVPWKLVIFVSLGLCPSVAMSFSLPNLWLTLWVESGLSSMVFCYYFPCELTPPLFPHRVVPLWVPPSSSIWLGGNFAFFIQGSSPQEASPSFPYLSPFFWRCQDSWASYSIYHQFHVAGATTCNLSMFSKPLSVWTSIWD